MSIDVSIECPDGPAENYHESLYTIEIAALERAVVSAWRAGATADNLREAIGSALATASGEEWEDG